MVRSLPIWMSAIAFDCQNRLILSHTKGVHILGEKEELLSLYDEGKYSIKHAGDMKIGPDGAIYVGTISEKLLGISDKTDGNLYRISQGGEVEILLDGLLLPNGLDWSMDEKKFYHVDTGMSVVREYFFDKSTGKITFSGRQVRVEGADGLTIGMDNNLYVSCAWKKYVAVIDGAALAVKEHIPFADTFPMSCGFCGENMDILAVTTASDTADVIQDKNAGFTHLQGMPTRGRIPYRFGGDEEHERKNF
jgi:sugar lactone lactonase YvrE